MNFHLPLISRILIALLFVVAGVQKLMDFSSFTGYVAALGLPMPALVSVLVVIIEVPVALAFAYGYKVRYTGGLLAVFTFLTIVIAHRDFSVGMNMMTALKNLAIIGGILATTGACSCNRCQVVTEEAKA